MIMELTSQYFINAIQNIETIDSTGWSWETVKDIIDQFIVLTGETVILDPPIPVEVEMVKDIKSTKNDLIYALIPQVRKIHTTYGTNTTLVKSTEIKTFCSVMMFLTSVCEILSLPFLNVGVLDT